MTDRIKCNKCGAESFAGNAILYCQSCFAEWASGKPTIWMLWVMSTSGLVSLRSICTSKSRAMAYRDGARHNERVIRAWLERRIANHLYAEMELEKNYPDERLARHLADELEARTNK